MKSKTIPQEIYDQVETEMLEGEQLLWVGLPETFADIGGSPYTLKRGVTMAVGLVVSLGILLFVLSGRGTMMNPMPFMIMGVVVVLLIVMMGGGVLQNFLRNRHTIYAVTDQRALIIDKKSVQSYGERDLDFIERHMRGANKGDIIFKREPRSPANYYMGGMYGGTPYDVPVGFFGIENPREVEALMLQTFRSREFGARIGTEKPKHEAFELVEAPPMPDEDDKAERLSR